MAVLGLGTVQFGLGYGVSNKTGQISMQEATKILNAASANKVCYLDTAKGYGESEVIIGQLLDNESDFKIVTKVPKIEGEKITQRDLEEMFINVQDSLKNLKRKSVYGILLHNADDLLKSNSSLLFDGLEKLRDHGVCEKVGVSVYTVEQAERILQQFNIDLIQVPINIFDQRFVESGVLKEIKKKGVEVHARSIFLQGVLLSDPGSLPEFFDPYRDFLDSYFTSIKEAGVSPLEAALGFGNAVKEVDVILVGVTSYPEWEEIRSSFDRKFNMDYSRFALDDAVFLNPSNWNIS